MVAIRFKNFINFVTTIKPVPSKPKSPLNKHALAKDLLGRVVYWFQILAAAAISRQMDPYDVC